MATLFTLITIYPFPRVEKFLSSILSNINGKNTLLFAVLYLDKGSHIFECHLPRMFTLAENGNIESNTTSTMFATKQLVGHIVMCDTLDLASSCATLKHIHFSLLVGFRCYLRTLNETISFT